MNTFAYCFADGHVQFGQILPEGALPIITKAPLKTIRAHCRLAYDNETLLVPGIPEANNQSEALNALERFIHRLDNLPSVKALV